MPEWRMILLLIAGPLLWMLGGSVWKPYRRVVWPLVVMALLCGLAAFWQIALVTLSLWLVNSLGYGEESSWSWRLGVFQTLMLPALWLNGTHWWLGVLCGAWLAVWMLLSRKANAVSWKVVEATAGISQAAVLIVAAQH